MRTKLIALFSLIVVVVAALGYALTRFAVMSVVAPDPNLAPRALDAAQAKLVVEGLATESWLARRAADPSVAEPFAAGTATARSESATGVADKIVDSAANAPELLGIRPSLVVLVDVQGVVLGRNASKQMRGENLGAAYPALKAAIEAGTSKTDIWVNRQRNEQLFASFAPVRNKEGAVVGAVVFASSIEDGRLNDASDKTSGQTLIVGVKGDKGFDVVAKSKGADQAITDALDKGAGEAALQSLTSGKTTDLSGLPAGYTALGRALEGYGDGKRAVLIAVVKPAERGINTALIWPALAAAILGLILVAIAGIMMDSYFSRPISEIEDGLLAIMNGQTAKRLEIEHAELGGVVFRINSLLNQLFGVAEDDTDEEGRPSRAPSGKGLSEAINVDESVAMSGGGGDTTALFAEPIDAYNARVFDEYIQAKRSVGDPTDHITPSDFGERLRASEGELSQKHGKPVRFKVEVKGKEVVLVAVPQG